MIPNNSTLMDNILRHNFGHKATQCVAYKTIITREARKQKNEKHSHNAFSPLQYET